MGKELVTADVLQRLIDKVAEGSTLSAACKLLALAPATVYAALQRYPQMQDELARARQAGAHAIADETIEIADTDPDPRRARVRCETRRWYAAKLHPQVYGEKLDLTVTQTVDVRGALEDARARLRPMRDQANVIDAEIVDKSTQSGAAPADRQSVVAPAAPEEIDIFS